ncbi:MAG TPA: hypothetical protein PLD88_00825 [Candidatus Berkiella sp.]|nr:hypothetical protein [Candidatus Berkiella sp.]
MRFLELSEQAIVTGGILLPAVEAIAVGVGIFEAPVLVNAAITQYGKWGSQIGETVFDATHPDVLGKIVFTQSDFQHYVNT